MLTVIFVVVAFAVGVFAGPTVRIFAAQLISEAKAEYEKEKAPIVAELATVKEQYRELADGSIATIAKLRTDLAAAEAKVETFTGLFKTVAASTPTAPVIPLPGPAPVPTV